MWQFFCEQVMAFQIFLLDNKRPDNLTKAVQMLGLTEMKSPFSQLSSFTASKAAISFPWWLTTAWCTSGYWVEEWFPQMITFFTLSEDTPTRIATYRHGGKLQMSKRPVCVICAYLLKVPLKRHMMITQHKHRSHSDGLWVHAKKWLL